MARNFIKNFFSGRTINPKQFSAVDTTPTLSPSGVDDEAWEKLKSDRPDMWSDPDLRRAGEEFTRLTAAQRNTFAKNGKKGVPLDFPHKATNLAVMAAWAFVAGVLQENKLRLEKHYALANRKGGDPLNASALAQGRHRTDPPQYRGLGNRSDAKERGRLAELFFLQAEDGEGIKKQSVERAIAAYQLKLAQLEVLRLESQRGA